MTGFFAIYTVFVLGLISPGPDFAVVIKNSLWCSKRIAVWTAVGIATGIAVHLSYIITGMGVILLQFPSVFATVKLMGAFYLVYLGVRTLLSTKAVASSTTNHDQVRVAKSNIAAFTEGFLTNMLNPKATMFFISLFGQMIDEHTVQSRLVLYGFIFMVTTFLWFTAVGVTLTVQRVYRRFICVQSYLMVVMGVVLILLGLQIAFSSLSH